MSTTVAPSRSAWLSGKTVQLTGDSYVEPAHLDRGGWRTLGPGKRVREELAGNVVRTDS